MRLSKHVKPHIVFGVAALVLSGIFAGIIIGPVFLYAQSSPGSAGTPFDPAQPQAEPDPFAELGERYDPLGVFNTPQPPRNFVEQTPADRAEMEKEKEKGAAEAAARAAEENRKALAEKFTCLTGFKINLKRCLAGLMNIVMWLAARTLWIAGVLLNITLHYTLNLNTLLEKLPIVDIGWKVLRDIANIVFIFITLWAGISITLGIGDRGKKAWGLLAQMVLVALFINFSLFITKAVVDASNIAALHFYNLITPPQNRLDWDGGLSDAFMQGLRLQTIYDPNSLSGGGNGPVAGMDLGGQSINMMNIILMGIFGSVFMLVAAFVFFAASIMFILRAVYLIMLMVLSPLAFVAWLLPGASGIASNWWSKLWSQAFFAPLYLALSYIVVYTINSPAFQQTMGALTNGGTGKSFAAAFTGNTAGPIIIVFNYIILTFFMVGCLIVAQSLGARGSELMMHWGQKLKGEGISLVGRQAMGGFHFREHGLIDRKGKDWAKHLEDKGLFGINKLKIAKDGKFSKYMRSMGGREVLSVRKLNETWEKSKLGQGTVGKFMREQTTGRLSESTFGGSKSAEQSYEEFEHMESRREDIRWGQQARDGVTQLAPLRKDLRAHYDKRLDAEKMVSTAEETYTNT